MMKFMTFLAMVAGQSACQADESIARYALADAEYHLVELDGAPFEARATLAFPQAGEVVGQAPCNRYSASQTEVYPWFNAGPIAATRMACPDLDAEAAFFVALEGMTLAEAVDQTLILTNTDGRKMVFIAR